MRLRVSGDMKVKLESTSSVKEITPAAEHFSEFGDNFVSVEGILGSDNFQELLSSGGTTTSGATESLTLYKCEPEPEPLENVEHRDTQITANSNLDQYEQQDQEFEAQEDQEIPNPVNYFEDEDVDLRPVQTRRSRKILAKESVLIIPRGSSSVNQISAQAVKNVEYFVRQNIDEYLVRRGFRQSADPSRPPPLHLPPKNKTHINVISYGPHYEAQEITCEIEKFWGFYSSLKAENPKMSEQIRPTLVPLLIHFYDECFLSGETAIALQLYTDFGNRFLQEDNTKENYNILLTISKVSTIEEFEGNELIQYLRRKDYIFRMTNVTFTALKVFLRSTGCPALVNLFSNRLMIQLEESTTRLALDEPNSGSLEGSTKTNNAVEKFTKANSNGSVRSNLPTLLVYATDGSPICGAISPQATMLAYGMSTSDIRVSFTSKRQLTVLNTEIKRIRRKRRLRSDNITPEADEVVDTGKELSAFNILKGHTQNVCGMVFHPKTRVLFSVSEDAKMKAWDLHEFECKADYRGHTAPIWCIDQTTTGHMLVTGSMDTTARIWVPERSDYLRLLAGHYFDVDCVKFHPNEAYVATGSLDKSVRLWSVNEGTLVRVFTGMNSPVSSIQFHENGKYLIGASEDPMILIWDINQSEIIAEIPCPPFCNDISLNGNMLSACFSNRTVIIWNLQPIVGSSTIEEIYKLRSPKVHECTEQSKTLFKLYYRDPFNLYCLGETLPSIQSRRQALQAFSRNPLTEGILAKPNQSRWEDLESEESESEINSEGILSQQSRSYRFDDGTEIDEQVNSVEANIKEEFYQFCS